MGKFAIFKIYLKLLNTVTSMYDLKGIRTKNLTFKENIFQSCNVTMTFWQINSNDYCVNFINKSAWKFVIPSKNTSEMFSSRKTLEIKNNYN